MGADDGVTVFISYARADAEAVGDLEQGLADYDHRCFVDRQMLGGVAWWEEILEQIRATPILLFALSPSSAQSRACQAELSYACALGKRIVPVMVRDTAIEDAPDALQTINVQRFVNPGHREYARLDTTLDEAEEHPWPTLPDPLPIAPPAPIADLSEAREKVQRSELTPDVQREVLAELAASVRNADDRPAAVAVLEQLVGHPDVVASVATEATGLLTTYRPPPRDHQSMRLMRSIVGALQREQCVPIVGSGMTNWLVGTRRNLASEWARQYDYPLNLGRRDDVPQVAQYISVTETVPLMRDDLGAFYRRQLKERFPEIVSAPVDGANRAKLDDILVEVWSSEARSIPGEPHRILARMPAPIFVSAQPTSLLSTALTAAGKRPREDFCRWQVDAPREWPPSPFKSDPDYVPSVEEPLVYHLFGTLEFPESIVIAEDDYFDFLCAVAEDPGLIPIQVSEAVADSSLLFLGFGLQDWDARVLLRTLINGEIAESLGKRFKHVAAEIESHEGVVSVEAAREYLSDYFGRFREPQIDIFWASIESFCEALEVAWLEETDGANSAVEQ